VKEPGKVVGVLSGLLEGRSDFRFPELARNYCVFQQVQITPGRHPASYSTSTGCPCPQV